MPVRARQMAHSRGESDVFYFLTNKEEVLMFKTYAKAALLFIASVGFAMFSILTTAAGTNVSSGISFTIGQSHTEVKEFGNYQAKGHGVSVSHNQNDSGFDYRKEVYKTETREGSKTSGNIYGAYQSIAHTNSAGILRSSSGIVQGASVSEMKSESWGQTRVEGRYVQISAQDGSHNYETGHFRANSGYLAESRSVSSTVYENTYSSTEFDY